MFFWLSSRLRCCARFGWSCAPPSILHKDVHICISAQQLGYALKKAVRDWGISNKFLFLSLCVFSITLCDCDLHTLNPVYVMKHQVNVVQYYAYILRQAVDKKHSPNIHSYLVHRATANTQQVMYTKMPANWWYVVGGVHYYLYYFVFSWFAQTTKIFLQWDIIICYVYVYTLRQNCHAQVHKIWLTHVSPLYRFNLTLAKAYSKRFAAVCMYLAFCLACDCFLITAIATTTITTTNSMRDATIATGMAIAVIIEPPRAEKSPGEKETMSTLVLCAAELFSMNEKL